MSMNYSGDYISDSDGGKLKPSSSVFRNRIINGAMVIDQRNAGASVTPTDGQYTLDRFVARLSQASKFTVQQSTTAPAGFINSLKVTSSSAYSVASGDYFAMQQNIEGLNCTDLGWGTANAKTVTLSFQVYSSLTGTFGGAISNGSQNRSYPFTYTVSSANTWTPISVTIAGDTSGTWLTTNGIGVMVFFGLGMGSTYSGTAGAWAGAAYLSATGATSVVGTSGATFYITGVQLEVGSSATGFEYRQYGQELALCQRYFEKSFNTETAPANGANSTSFLTEVGLMCAIATNRGGASGTGASVTYKVSKRATPTITQYGNNAGQWGSTAANGGTPAFASGLTAARIGVNSFTVNQQVTDGVFLLVSGHWAASAEL